MFLAELSQIIIGFVFGLLMGPLGAGLFWFIISIVIFEALVLYQTTMLPPAWRFEARVAINCAGFIGWVLGRWLLTDSTGFEEIDSFEDILPLWYFRREFGLFK